jgi:hypothetical protein
MVAQSWHASYVPMIVSLSPLANALERKRYGERAGPRADWP